MNLNAANHMHIGMPHGRNLQNIVHSMFANHTWQSQLYKIYEQHHKDTAETSKLSQPLDMQCTTCMIHQSNHQKT